MKSQKGITIITLSVTVIVLTIIVGIMFSAGIGNKSQIKETTEMSIKSFHDNVADALRILQTPYTSKSEYISFLKSNGYMYADNTLNVRKVLNTIDCELGLGSNLKDVYLLDNELNLIYYDTNGSTQTLANLSETMEE